MDSGRKHALDGDAHWHHLTNITEPSMCCGDAALCQITLTTCSTSSRKSEVSVDSLNAIQVRIFWQQNDRKCVILEVCQVTLSQWKTSLHFGHKFS